MSQLNPFKVLDGTFVIYSTQTQEDAESFAKVKAQNAGPGKTFEVVQSLSIFVLSETKTYSLKKNGEDVQDEGVKP